MSEMENMNTALQAAEENALANPNAVHGFEEANAEDIVIPRIKVINALSPERQDGVAEEGDILNSLTQENVKGLRFIPIKQYYSNIEWNPDRNAELRIFCRSYDGRIGRNDEGSCSCAQCGKNKFDNSKTGKDAQPRCTAYMNFLGFFEGNPMPVVLSFARTNYNEGKKLLSIAKSMRQSIWNFAYTLDSRLVTATSGTSSLPRWLARPHLRSAPLPSSCSRAMRICPTPRLTMRTPHMTTAPRS